MEVAGEPLLVVRGADGEVRAFANTCRHRGTRLLDGAGTVRAITCPYHAWTYGLDGQLRGSPNVGLDDGIDRDRIRLWSVRLEEFDGFLFVTLDDDAGALRSQLENAEDSPLELARYRVGDLVAGAHREYEVAANWKVVVENYHECLHCPTVHPELVKIVPLYRSGEVEEDGQLLGNSMGEGLTTFTATGVSTLPPLPGLDETDIHTFYGVYVFPNLIINYHSDMVNAVRIHPTGSRHHARRERLPLRARGRRGPRVRPLGVRRVPRSGRPAGLVRLRTGAARRPVSVLHGRDLPAPGEVDRDVQPSVPRRARRRMTLGG